MQSEAVRRTAQPATLELRGRQGGGVENEALAQSGNVAREGTGALDEIPPGPRQLIARAVGPGIVFAASTP